MKLAVELLEANGEDGMPMEAFMSSELLAERNRLDRDDDIGEEMNSVIEKLKNAVKVLENPDNFTVGLDGVKLDV